MKRRSRCCKHPSAVRPIFNAQEHAVLQKEYRTKTNILIASVCQDDPDVRKKCWNELYGELIAQTGFEVYAAAKFGNCSPLDAVEIQGAMERLYHIASEFLVASNN